MKTEKQIEHLHKNITRLSAIVTSGVFIPTQSEDDDWGTINPIEPGEKLTKGALVSHIDALIHNLKELNETILTNN
jgi:hypothetical protein